ncbi:TIGR03960 family B12-binding radical SAM protein [Desulfonatronovibrio hydrogenovorans]|uniref:TIGR03960 family B12-binding radical SAM protein n=1 Tax=Desulfonatronovibrio hydrogenovorans TaxID=53245 RepID=UPI00048FB618|nr:TIGR03960 family B12-binding radical SAM protein [Desulfonatronovibrio hydrogenovorans]
MKELLPFLPKPSHYLGNEINSIHKDKAHVAVHLGLAFPDRYEVGMSYLGQKLLYKQINDQPDFWAERIFAPSMDAARILKEHNLPLCTLESDTPLMDLDILAFSLTHELCYTNILFMLDLAGIPLRSAERSDQHPLVIAGGGAVFNAEPVADFFDLMVLGDGEELLVIIAEAVKQAREAGSGRNELLARLKDFPGVYIPSFFRPVPQGKPIPVFNNYQRVFKALVNDLNQVDFPTSQVLPFGKIVHDRLSVEIARGCTRGCRFCQAGIIYRPVRERKVPDLVDIINNGLKGTGLEELSFLSLSTGDFSALERLFLETFAGCQSRQVSISLPSLRVGSVSERLMQLMARIRRTHVTLAPEAGTQRLRDVINKGIHEDELLSHTQALFRLGWNGAKLYFMLGLPTETLEDIKGIRDLCLKVLETGKHGPRRIQVTASISLFVPKPQTPFQWESQMGLEEAREKISYLRELFRPHKKLSLKWHDPEMSLLEGVFSRGGRELSRVVESAWRKGQVFTSWSDHFSLEPWLEILKQEELDPEIYLRSRTQDQALPWDHLDSGVSRKYLASERSRALETKITRDCRYHTCRSCGVCDRKNNPSRLQGPGRTRVDNILNLEHRDQEGQNKAVDFEQQELFAKNFHYRIWYEKTGLSVYLSQLELQSLLERAMRRCDLPLSFSRGFRPMPLISFGQALSVGIASLAEWFNVFLRQAEPEKKIIDGLNMNLPNGLKVLRVEELSLGRKQAQARLEEFRVEFRPDRQDVSELQKIWSDFVKSDLFMVEKQGKKKVTNRDIRGLVKSSQWQGHVLELTFSWEKEYLSPLFVIQRVFQDLGPDGFTMTKTRQII